jgi:hypothetical protein
MDKNRDAVQYHASLFFIKKVSFIYELYTLQLESSFGFTHNAKPQQVPNQPHDSLDIIQRTNQLQLRR